MPLPYGNYNKGGRFGFPRSYIDDFYVYRNGDTFTQSFNVITVHDVFPSLTTATFVIDNRFWLWTSNYWTMDHIIVDSHYNPNGLPPDLPLPFQLNYFVSPTTGRAGLFIDWTGTPTDPRKVIWPDQPGNYWLPEPLP